MVLKRSQLNFCGFCKNRFPIWVATQNRFLRPTSFGKQPKRLLSPKAHFRFPKNRTIFFKKEKSFEACLFEKGKAKKPSPIKERRGFVKLRFVKSKRKMGRCND